MPGLDSEALFFFLNSQAVNISDLMYHTVHGATIRLWLCSVKVATDNPIKLDLQSQAVSGFGLWCAACQPVVQTRDNGHRIVKMTRRLERWD